MDKTPAKIQHLLKQVVDNFTREDQAVRQREIRKWRKLKMYWNNFQRVYYSDTAHDWRVPDEVQLGQDNSYYDRPVNVFRAYLESIFAALSVSIPAAECAPEDANNALDITTAKAGNKIYEMLSNQLDAKLLWLKMLYIYGTEGLIAAYNYSEEDEDYGTVKTPKYKTYQEPQQSATCPTCDSPVQNFTEQPEQYQPSGDQVFNQPNYCPNCMDSVEPKVKTEDINVERLIGFEDKAKSKQCIEILGGLYVKVPNWASKQKDIPYLFYCYETHYGNVIEKFPDLDEAFKSNGIGRTSGVYDPYERWGRLNPQYYGEFPIDTVTVRNVWLRHSAFNVLKKEEAALLKEKYPNGCKVIFVNETFAYACDENLDDHWSLSRNPLSDYLHHDPLGMLLVSLQDITNDLLSLVVQTVEHGIPQTFVDPAILNVQQYSQNEVLPGALVQTRPGSGKNISDGFYEVKTATLSSEVLPFGDKVQQLAQFVSGAVPSIFGGAQQGGGDTAAQYSMSRAQALQRLQTPWEMLRGLWKDIWTKTIPSFIEDMMEDEKFVTKDQNNNFINVFIRKAEVMGKIGYVTLSGSENLPQTWAQKKDTIMAMLSAANPLVLQMIAAPENLGELREALGLNDFYIPGEDDRTKQLEEITELTSSQPIDQITPSIQVDELLDDHKIEAEICRGWLLSDAGRLCKVENPNGYRNVLLHMQGHTMIMQHQQEQQMMSQVQANAQPGPKSEPKPAAKNTGAQQNGPGTTGVTGS